MRWSKNYTLRVAALMLLLICLFPPWTQTVHFGQVRSETPVGYAFIFNPPRPAKDGIVFGIVMDTRRLLCEIAATLALLGIAWTFTRKRIN